MELSNAEMAVVIKNMAREIVRRMTASVKNMTPAAQNYYDETVRKIKALPDGDDKTV